MTAVANTVRVATRVGSRRAMSDSAGPKMHKAKDAWKEIKSTRPPEGHPHVSGCKYNNGGKTVGGQNAVCLSLVLVPVLIILNSVQSLYIH